MSLRIGDLAPDFSAKTTKGEINFHEWIGDGWAVLFSHPKDFTPVCTTELGSLASLQPEFEKRNAKVIGLSVDPVEDHHRWVDGHPGCYRAHAAISDHRRHRFERGENLSDATRIRSRIVRGPYGWG